MESKTGTSARLPSLREWRAYFRSRGLRDELAKQYIAYIQPLTRQSLPVIFDFQHLALLLGRSPDFLARAMCAPEYFYRSFDIPKKSGGARKITAPYPALKECQRWIAKEIVEHLPVHPSATAYMAGGSILGNVAQHLEIGRQFLIVDIENFFPTITKKRLIGWFHSLGYNFEVSIALGSLCCVHGKLPQGSPASPCISNSLCLQLDRRLYAIASRFGLRYTRYADDLCFSGSIIHSGLLRLVQKAVHDSGFALNAKKTRIHGPRSTSKVITGINVSSGTPRLPRDKRRQLKQTLHFISTFGYLSHKQKLKITDSKYLLRIRGQLEYWRLLEPDNLDVRKYLAHIAGLQHMHGDG